MWVESSTYEFGRCLNICRDNLPDKLTRLQLKFVKINYDNQTFLGIYINPLFPLNWFLNNTTTLFVNIKRLLMWIRYFIRALLREPSVTVILLKTSFYFLKWRVQRKSSLIIYLEYRTLLFQNVHFLEPSAPQKNPLVLLVLRAVFWILKCVDVSWLL